MRAWIEVKWRGAVTHPGLFWVMLLWPLSLLYRLAERLNDWRQRGQRVRVAGLRIISVGNLSVGGTGKTPLTLALLGRLATTRGLAALSRGYGAVAGTRPLVVSRGAGPLLGARQSGDEPRQLALRSKRAVVLVDSDRARGALYARDVLGARVLILDDGFQRRHRLLRDLDIVLLDYHELGGSRRLLPAGVWREPLENARDADLIVISRAPHASSLNTLRGLLPTGLRQKPLFRMTLRPKRLFEASSGKAIPLKRLRGLAVAAFSGIARPDDFESSLRILGARVDARLRFGDHGPIDQKALNRLAWLSPRSQAWVCTEKDWARLDPNLRVLRPVWVLGVEALIDPAPLFWRKVRSAITDKASA